MNLLLDATLPPRLARALHLLLQPEHTAAHVRDLLGNDASDRMLLQHVHEHPGSLVLGIDLEVIDNPHRLAAMRECRCPVFLLSSAWLEVSEWNLVWMAAKRMPSILEIARTVPGPSIYLVPPVDKGRIRKQA